MAFDFGAAAAANVESTAVKKHKVRNVQTEDEICRETSFGSKHEFVRTASTRVCWTVMLSSVMHSSLVVTAECEKRYLLIRLAQSAGWLLQSREVRHVCIQLLQRDLRFHFTASRVSLLEGTPLKTNAVARHDNHLECRRTTISPTACVGE